MRRIALLTVLALSVTGVSVGVALRAHGAASKVADVATPGPASGPEASGGSRDPARHPIPRWELGSARTYETAYAYELAPASGAAVTTSTARATLTFTVVRVTDDEVVLRAELRDVVLTQSPAAERGAGIETPFYLTLAKDGAWRRADFVRGVSADARRVQQTLASILQIVRADDESHAWERVETDATGEFCSTYSWQGEKLAKSKVRYLRLKTPTGFVSVEDIGSYDVTSTTRVEIDGTGFPRAVDSSEKAETALGNDRLHVSSSATAKLVATSSSPALVGSFEAARGAFDPDADGLAEAAKRARRTADESITHGVDFGSLHAAAAREGAAEQAHAVVQMAALFRVRPETIAEARAALRRAPTGPEARSILGALGGAGTPEAHRALGDVLSASDLPRETRQGAAMALGMGDATAEARGALRDAARSNDPEIASAATLALGAQIHRAGDGEDRAEAVDALVARLRAATSSDEKILCLDALGNAGIVRTLPAILPLAADGDSLVRAAAITALRFMIDPRASAALSVSLADREPRVRLAAADALLHQPVAPFVQQLAFVLQHEEAPVVRVAVVRALASALDTAPEVADILGWTATHDSSADVRDAATAALSRPPS